MSFFVYPFGTVKVSDYLRVGKKKGTFVQLFNRRKTMKKSLVFGAALLLAAPLAAQEFWELDPRKADLEAGRIYRTEVIPYALRHDAEARNRDKAGAVLPFAPKEIGAIDAGRVAAAIVEIPFEWTDGLTYLHLENVGSAYSLYLNGALVAEVEDPLTPAEFHLSPLVVQGRNDFRLLLRPSDTPGIDPEPAVRRTPFAESYLYNQHKRSIRDFEIALVPDSMRRDGILELKILALNGYNYDEKVEAGFDIYSPQGRLLDFNIREIPLPGRSTDTVRFHPFIYHVNQNRWTADTKAAPPVYRAMLFTRRDGTYREYMPLLLGFGRTEFAAGRLLRHDEVLQLKRTRYNAAADRKTTLAEVRALKAKGFNTLCPDYPQPAWFYDLCTEQGLYVIDRAAIAAPERRTDRRVGGTPSNDPALVGEYLERVKAMYYRSRNYPCVIAFALGAPSGNGYNMYKAYEWLKSVERHRPVLYEDAAGEWNSDTEE